MREWVDYIFFITSNILITINVYNSFEKSFQNSIISICWKRWRQHNLLTLSSTTLVVALLHCWLISITLVMHFSFSISYRFFIFIFATIKLFFLVYYFFLIINLVFVLLHIKSIYEGIPHLTNKKILKLQPHAILLVE